MADITGFNINGTTSDFNTTSTGGSGITIKGTYTGGGNTDNSDNWGNTSTNDEDIIVQVLVGNTWVSLGNPTFTFGSNASQKTFSLSVTNSTLLSYFNDGSALNSEGKATFRFVDNDSTPATVPVGGAQTFSTPITTAGIYAMTLNTATSELNPAGGITLKGTFAGGGNSTGTTDNDDDVVVWVRAQGTNTWYELTGQFTWNFATHTYEFNTTDSDLARYTLGSKVEFRIADDNDSQQLGDDNVFVQSVVTLCFYPGTMIATPEGEKAVETLEIGDMVLLQDGSAAPVRWMGRNTISLLFADKLKSLPIRIRKDALGENVPSRDLLVSPDHAIFVEGILAQAATLVNGTSIVRETNVPGKFTYHHIELAQHAIVMADNTPAETFVDNVDRMAYDNWAEHEALFGDLPAIVEMDLPRAKSQRQVPAAIRKALADRAVALGYSDVISAVA